jgi:single-stranded-DNA-specific exonuclease
MTRWINPASAVNTDSLSALNLHPLVAHTLIRRGIDSPEAARAFLFHGEIPPTPFPDIEKAVEIIQRAIHGKEKICVWGDFDVDGQTSTALLVQALQAIGADVVYYIPIRGKESHGVHIETLAPIIDNGAKLIVTCDTGITAHEAIDYANARGADVIVTDHHDLGGTLPNAKVIINPKLLPKEHRLANLAGVGVAYKLAEALLNSEFRRVNFELLDLVALGLIADVALLKGETRSLAQKGIKRLRETQRLGLKIIAELSGANLETLTEETIGFTFAPRLNALGRLSDANPAVELLLTQDATRARVLANQIEGLNQNRRFLTSQVYEAAEAQLKANPQLLETPVIVLSHSGWPGGVVGIVANKLADRYHKPAILFNDTDGVLRGSARSVEGLHITDAIAANKDLLRGFGGHPMAAGMSLDADKLDDFRRGLGKAIEKQLGEIVREEPTLQIDAWLDLDDLNLELADALEALAPFGAGNPSLTLATRGVKLKSVATIGKTKEHLRMNVEDENGNIQSILWWGGAGEPDSLTSLSEGTKFDIAYSLRASTYRGQKQLSIQFEEFRIAEERPIEIPSSKIDIRDLRLQSATLNLEPFDVAQDKPSTLIWAEGADKEKGKSRFDLYPADALSIYTTPPSHAELRKALEIVKPTTIYAFGISPAEEKTEDFLNRLAGLCKYTLSNYKGQTTIQKLAAAMASRENAIHLGLEWLGAAGHLHVEIEAGEVNIKKGNGIADPYLQGELFIALRGILKEIAAYRKYFGTVADLDTLLEM